MHSTFEKDTTYEGTLYFGKNGIGYVRIPDFENVIEIPAHKTNATFHKDRVVARVTSTDKTTGAVGEVIKVTSPAQAGHVCEIVRRDDHFLAIPLDYHNKHREIVMPEADESHMKKRIFVTISGWKDSPIGHIERVLGDLDSHNGYMEGYALEQGFDPTFPENLEEIANNLADQGITDADRRGRRDMREVTTFTIDPDDAKDFDDALSVAKLENGNYEIGIHIADVSHYITPDSELDEEAQERATSVYLVDRTIPMLPEALSNNLCSLRPEEEKLAFSVVFTMTANGDIRDTWYGRTLIESNKRFSYEEAQDVVNQGHGPFFAELSLLNLIAKRYRLERIEAGALSLEKEELRFILDENGKPLEIRKKVRKDMHKMIEEWMLLANQSVAQYVSEKTNQSFMVYRIHDRPDPRRVLDLRNFLKSLGYEVQIKDGVIPSQELDEIVRKAKSDDERDIISLNIARSMAKAVYSLENIGHYGLGFTFYTHFTSPIRRYPDVLVHRLLQWCLDNEELSRQDYEEFEQMVAHSTERERQASEAERASIKYAQARYMENRVGQMFTALVTGVTDRGCFLAEVETKSDGFSRLRDIDGDYWEYDAKKIALVGRKTGKEIHVGSRVKAKLTKVDIGQGFVDYKILGIEQLPK